MLAIAPGCTGRPQRSIAVGLVLAVSVTLASTAHGQDSGLKVKGDFRLRYENNANLLPDPARIQDNTRNRGVVRFRAGIAKDINDLLVVLAPILDKSRGADYCRTKTLQFLFKTGTG